MAIIRSEDPGDIESIRSIHRAGFPTNAEAQLVDLLREASHLTVSLVAEVDREVVGHIAFSPASTSSDTAGVGLAPVAVLPGFRCRGIGAKLVEAGLAACRSAGLGWVVVLGEPHYYSRFGFRPASDHNLVDEYGGGSAFQVLELRPGALPSGPGIVRYSPEFGSLG